MLRIKLLLVGLAVFGLAGSAAHAATFQFQCGPVSGCPGGNHRAGEMIALRTTFDTHTERFTWDARFKATNGNLPDSGWLVVSDGPNPKGGVDEYAIMYLDGANGHVTAHVYNGQNSANSYQLPNSLLASFQNALQTTNHPDGTRSMRSAIDASAVNSAFNTPDWDGIAFGPDFGMWYHPSSGSQFSYGLAGEVTSFKMNDAGWYDHKDLPTEAIPEPTGAAVFALGALLMRAASGRARRR